MVSPHPFPEAFLLGAMRGGTTFLHDALSAHPDVAAPAAKEPQFFTLHWERGPAFYRSQLPRRWPAWIYALARRPRPLTIDSSPYYLFHPEAPPRLRSTIGPAAKCIVLLRNPVDRAWSHYRMMLASGREHLGFREAIAREHDRIQTPMAADPADPHQLPPHLVYSYIARGLYAQQLEHWWNYIPRNQFLLLRSEDLYRAPEAVFGQVCDFLALKKIPLPSSIKQNAAAPLPLPDEMRSCLATLFAEPNRRLFELTGIGW